MQQNELIRWCERLCSAWGQKDFKELCNIFSFTKIYYEDPFSPPGTSIDKIISFWDEIQYQSINTLSIVPIMFSEKEATLHWFLDYSDVRDSATYVMDGIYYVTFDTQFRCISFSQWWVLKED